MITAKREPRRGSWLAGRPIRTKLALLLAPPVAALLALSALFGFTAFAAADTAEQARRVVAAGAIGADLAAQLQLERAAAGLVFASRSKSDTLTMFRQQSTRTDAILDRFTAARSGLAVPAGLSAPLNRLDEQMIDLPLLREQVRAGKDVTATTVAFRYRTIIADLVVFRSGLAQLSVDADTATGLRATASLSQSIEGLGLLQTAVLPWLGADTLPAAAQQQVVSAAAAHTESLETFRLLAPQWQARLTAASGSRDVVAEERLTALAVSAVPNTRLNLDTDAAGWVAALNARMTQLHTVEAGLDRDLLAAVTAQRDAQHRQIGWLATAVGISLLILVAVGWWVTRSMTRPLKALADGAIEMALSTLPSAVERLVTDTADPRAVEQVLRDAERPLPVVGRDEIALVSTAFNRVASQAVRLAGDQARSRAATALVAEHLGRQLQRLIDRVTARLDELLSTEENPAQLQVLNSIDERVQPGRLLINNLLVLAGGRAGLVAKAAMVLPDVVVAASGQVNGAYRRVIVDVTTDVLVEPDAVEELVHLLAVLIDNAIRASAPPQPVQVHGQRINDRVLLQVSDTGIGIPGTQLAELQHRLSDTVASLDGDTAKHMGLAVAGRISRRLGITLTLRSDPGAGTHVDIELPPTLFHVDPYGGRPDPRALQPNAGRPAAAAPALPRAGAAPAGSGPTPAQITQAAALPAPPSAAPDPAATVLLPVLGSSGPPTWPLPAAEPQIFQEVADQHAWFTAAGADDRAALTVPDDWQQASTAAERVSQDLAARATTTNGLPRRQPGQYTIPTPPSPRTVPRPRNHAAAARGLSSLSATVRASKPAPARPKR